MAGARVRKRLEPARRAQGARGPGDASHVPAHVAGLRQGEPGRAVGAGGARRAALGARDVAVVAREARRIVGHPRDLPAEALARHPRQRAPAPERDARRRGDPVQHHHARGRDNPVRRERQIQRDVGRVGARQHLDQARRGHLHAVVDVEHVRAGVGLEHPEPVDHAGDGEADYRRVGARIQRADEPHDVLAREVVEHADRAGRAQLAGAGDARPAAAVQVGRARGADTGRRVERVLSRRAEGAEGGSGAVLVRPSRAKKVARGADRGLVRPGRRRRAARLRGIILVKARRARRAGGGEGVGAGGAGSTGGRIRPAAARAAHVVPDRAGPVRAAVVRAAGGDVGRVGHVAP